MEINLYASLSNNRMKKMNNSWLSWLKSRYNSVEEYKDFCREINKKYSPELIISSSLKRAIDSTKIFQEISKKEIIINSLCNERKSWVAEWKHINEIDWKTMKNYLSQKKHKWWESFKEIKERAKNF